MSHARGPSKQPKNPYHDVFVNMIVNNNDIEFAMLILKRVEAAGLCDNYIVRKMADILAASSHTTVEHFQHLCDLVDKKKLAHQRVYYYFLNALTAKRNPNYNLAEHVFERARANNMLNAALWLLLFRCMKFSNSVEFPYALSMLDQVANVPDISRKQILLNILSVAARQAPQYDTQAIQLLDSFESEFPNKLLKMEFNPKLQVYSVNMQHRTYKEAYFWLKRLAIRDNPELNGGRQLLVITGLEIRGAVLVRSNSGDAVVELSKTMGPAFQCDVHNAGAKSYKVMIDPKKAPKLDVAPNKASDIELRQQEIMRQEAFPTFVATPPSVIEESNQPKKPTSCLSSLFSRSALVAAGSAAAYIALNTRLVI